MKVIVLSDKHHLLPVAWRLRREGHDTEVAVVHRRKDYARAWGGKLTSFLDGPIEEDTFTKVRSAAEEGDATVLTDSRRWSETFEGYPKLFGVTGLQDVEPTAVSIGAWFDGEGFMGTHLLIQDLGIWPGGLGPKGVSSVTLIRLDNPEPWQEALNPKADSLKSLGFKGLLRAGIGMGENGLAMAEPELGWPFLHTHAFCSDLPNLGNILNGYAPEFPKRHVVAVAVSVPPWPLKGTSKEQQVLGLEADDMAHVWFHDMKVESETEVWTAKTDGLVAVVRGSGNHLTTARSRALELAGKIQLEEKQYRFDAAGQVDQVLATLEAWGAPI